MCQQCFPSHEFLTPCHLPTALSQLQDPKDCSLCWVSLYSLDSAHHSSLHNVRPWSMTQESKQAGEGEICLYSYVCASLSRSLWKHFKIEVISEHPRTLPLNKERLGDRETINLLDFLHQRDRRLQEWQYESGWLHNLHDTCFENLLPSESFFHWSAYFLWGFSKKCLKVRGHPQ